MKKAMSQISDSYITLLILFPYLLFYFNGFYTEYIDKEIIPILLVLIYSPTIVWSLAIRKKDTTAKYHIGSNKLLFSLNALPLVSLLFINFLEPNFMNTVNIYIVLMTALFFTLDGQSDLLDSFKQTRYYKDAKLRKIAFNVYSRLLRRFVFFLGVSLLIAIWYLIFITNYYMKLIEYPEYIFSIVNSSVAIIGTFLPGWILLALNSHKKVREILEEKIISNENVNIDIYTWINLLYIPRYIKLLITWGPIVLFTIQLVILKFLFLYISIKEIILIHLGTGLILYLLIIMFQKKVFIKNKIF